MLELCILRFDSILCYKSLFGRLRLIRVMVNYLTYHTQDELFNSCSVRSYLLTRSYVCQPVERPTSLTFSKSPLYRINV